eukprot:8757858-Pyramimonas_sp.AAC.1
MMHHRVGTRVPYRAGRARGRTLAGGPGRATKTTTTSTRSATTTTTTTTMTRATSATTTVTEQSGGQMPTS